jgi:hypothetical protein
MKLLPVTVSVNAEPPATAVLGDSEVSVGLGFGAVIVNVCGLDVPPPGEGVNTVTEAVPAVAMSAAPICAVSCVLLPNVVARWLPFHCTMDELMKFVPVSVSVKAAPPASTLLGEIELSVGLGFGALMVNVCALDAPPPGVGLNTVTGTVPAATMSAAVIWAWSWVLLTNVVVRLLPFQRTTDVVAKFVPVAVSVKAGPPAVALLGEIELSVGAGLLIVNVWEADVPPPGVGVKTVTGTVPPAAISLALICAVSCVLLTKVVVRLLPFQRTTDVIAKFVPVAVSVKAAPAAAALVGEIELSVGTGFVAVIVNVTEPEVPPPGVGLKTVTAAVPVAAMSLAGIAACSVVLLTNVVVRLLPFQRTTDEAM